MTKNQKGILGLLGAIAAILSLRKFAGAEGAPSVVPEPAMPELPPTCTEGEERCVDKDLFRCINNEWCLVEAFAPECTGATPPDEEEPLLDEEEEPPSNGEEPPHFWLCIQEVGRGGYGGGGICGAEFLTKDDLESHLSREHMPESHYYECTNCSPTFVFRACPAEIVIDEETRTGKVERSAVYCPRCGHRAYRGEG